jgi:hypothetical protein
MTDLALADSLATLASPAILFFFLGALAAFAKSDLTIPEQATKTLSLYLMLCIGFKGGVEARDAGLTSDFLTTAGLGIALSALMPLLAFVTLRSLSVLDRATICAVAAAFGSVSVVTFAAGSDYLASLGLAPSGYMAAVLALMETPAILTALLLLNMGASDKPSRTGVLREVFFNAATVMLIGSFVVGLITGEPGMQKLDVFVGPLFQGALCLFLLDIGLVAARRLMADRAKMSLPIILFAIGFPLVSAAVAVVLSRLAGLSVPDAAMLTILSASASYIAVPAAMRMAAPKADAGIYVTISLAVTFPFNLVVGIPLYTQAVRWWF